MAKVNELKICPYCEAILKDTNEEFCKVCNADLIYKENKLFQHVDHYERQFFKKQIEFNYFEREKPQTKEQSKQWMETKKTFEEFILDLPTVEKISTLIDARYVISNVVVGPHNLEDIRKIVSIGKAIGEAAQAIENYIKTGGVIRGKTRPVQTESGNSAVSETGDN